MKNPKLGIQLFTLRDYIKNYEDTDKTFEYLSGLGVRDVQISAIGPIEPEKVAELVYKYNLEVCVTHKPFDRMRNDLDALIEEHKLIDCDSIGLGAMPEEFRSSVQAVENFIRITDEIGKKMKKQGMRFAYHNHALEFARLENGKTIMDMLIEETDPETFTFIPDTYWMHMGGVNECDCLRRMKGRVKVCHFKDWMIVGNEPRFTEIGCGNLDLDACYNTCREIGVSHIVYEQDANCKVNPLESTAISWENMNKIAARNA